MPFIAKQNFRLAQHIENYQYSTNLVKAYIQRIVMDIIRMKKDGVEFTDTTGRRRVSNYWPASTAYQTGSCIAYVWDDPLVVYEMQAAGSLTQASIGEQFDITNATAGSNVTGLSQCTLGTTAAGAGNSKQMRVVNLAPFPGNAWGDAYTVVQVQIAEHQYVADRGAI